MTIISFSWLTANIAKDFRYAYRNCNSTQNHPRATPSSQWEWKGCFLWGSSGFFSNKSIFRVVVYALIQLKNITWLRKTVLSPFLLSVQKSNAHSVSKGMYLQIHTCVSKTDTFLVKFASLDKLLPAKCNHFAFQLSILMTLRNTVLKLRFPVSTHIQTSSLVSMKA